MQAMSELLTGICQEGIDRHFLALPLLMGLLAMTASCGSEKMPQLIDSGVGGNLNASVQWLNDEEIIFQGIEVNDGTPPTSMNLSIWTVGKGIAVYKHHVRWFCAKNATLAYSLEGNDAIRLYGTRGNEVPMDSHRVAAPTCQPLPEKHDPERDLIPLLPAHGFIDRGAVKGPPKNDPIVYFKTGSSHGMELPLRIREVGGFRYFPFKSAYFIASEFYDTKTGVGRSPWPVTEIRPLWWMTPDGAVTTQSIGAPWNASAEFHPTAAGLVSHGYDERIEKARWPQDAGLFLIRPNGSVTKIAAGQVMQVAVSPNGCSIAFFHLERPMHHETMKLKSINLCIKGD
jgi:hypothetical protein